MGNTGVDRTNIEAGDHHVHYQLKDPAGDVVNPTDFWNRQGPVDPNPAQPAYVGENQQYRRGLGTNAPAAPRTWSLLDPAPKGSDASGPFAAGGQFVPGSASSSQPLYATRSFVAPSDESAPPDTGKNTRRLARRVSGKADLAGYKRSAAPDGPVSTSLQEGAPATAAFRPDAVPSLDSRRLSEKGSVNPPPPEPGRPLGIVTGKPMPDWPFPLPIFDFPNRSGASGKGNGDWLFSLLAGNSGNGRKSRASVFDTGAPRIRYVSPGNSLSPDRQNSFGNGAASPAGNSGGLLSSPMPEPQESQIPASALLQYLEYLK